VAAAISSGAIHSNVREALSNWLRSRGMIFSCLGSKRKSPLRWGVILADRAQPGIFAHKRVLMTPGLNHNGLAHALQRRGCTLHYADPLIYFNLPALPGVGSKRTLEQAAPATLEQLADAPFRRVQPQVGKAGKSRSADPFEWADLLAGDIGAIRRYAPDRLAHKTVVVESATEEDLADLRRRGAAIAVTMMPSLEGEADSGLGRWPAATIEALLVALRPYPSAPLSEDTYLDMLAEIRWTPAVKFSIDIGTYVLYTHI
jgi:hypothetical protein